MTEADITNRSVTECGMLLGDGFAITDTNATVTDTVTLGQGKTLITNDGGTGSDITLAASDTLDITSTSEVDIPAAAVSGAEADTDTTVARNNTVTVNGTIQSKNDINLYADKDADGNKAALTMDTAAEAYNHSVIPIAAPSIDNKLTQDNQVVVSSTGRGESVRHIDISADTGKESIREMTGTYTWYGGGTDQDVSYVGTSEGQEAKYKTASNTVRVDGTLIAGTNDVQNVVISGNVAPPNSVAANGSGDSEYTITLNGAAMEGATVTTMDYGNVLFDRYQETTKLMNEYYGKYEESGSEKDLSAYLGYKAEQERIFDQMEKAGLTVSVTKDGVTMTYPIEVDGNYIHVVELPDIVSSGGNINIDTDTLYGQGSFDAHGTPEINIKNESTAYLKLNDLTIGEVGGGIVYNGQSIGDNDMIAGLNRDKSKTVNFAAIMADGEVGDAAVFVHSTNTGAMQIRPEGQANGETHSWTPIKTIEIGGVIENLLGTVTITNDAGDIIIQNDDNTAGIEAKIVKLTATGAVAQGFTDGIVNIGGNPEAQWKDHANTQQSMAGAILDANGY
ncbi:MAG: hypothetical protein IIW43_05520, partial [Selenomonadales bacterium]|nr:hypothetical protein [Selenomonadales bacterium]